MRKRPRNDGHRSVYKLLTKLKTEYSVELKEKAYQKEALRK